MLDAYQFNAQAAPIPIMAARWPDDDPYAAQVFFQNARFTDLYGNLLGQDLVDIFENTLKSSEIRTSLRGSDLLADLLKDKKIQYDYGLLSQKRVGLFAWIEDEAPKTIQLTLFDTTHHYVDVLTGIPRRELFFDRLKIELLRAVREKTEVHLCFLDLDGFKPINDSYGHHVGDGVLKEVARRLQELVRRHETVARLGGDEFILILSGQSIDPLDYAESKIIPTLNAPYHIDNHMIDTLGVSVGIASFPKFAAKADELLTYADDAMYAAKAKGKNQAVLFDPMMLGTKHI